MMSKQTEALAEQPAQRKPLTKAAITHMAAEHQLYEDLPANEFEVALHKFARAIEAKLREKNA